MSRLYDVTREEVETAFKAVKRAGGGAGFDGQTIADVEKDLDNQLYKIWNRMSSGSLKAQPVLMIDIPKAKGGVRHLGIPTVTDRIAQMVIKNRLEPILEDMFHEDSYAYRPCKSAIDAVTVCRERCFKHEWLVEVDIKGFFDTLDHEKLMQMVESVTTDQTVLLYVRKFLKARGRMSSGEEIERTEGTPQGGVVSPILSNLYLHEAFDQWMEKNQPTLKFERYADDIVIHCVSEKQAMFIRDKVRQRLSQYKLELHPEKTRIVYTGTSNDHDKRGHGLNRKFTFLGYDFKPRMYHGRLVFTPGIGHGAMKMLLVKIREEWRLGQRIGERIEAIAQEINPQIRGWITYYGHHRRSDLNRLGYRINRELVRYMRKKHKQIRTWNQGWRKLIKRRNQDPELFSHWHMIRQKRGAV